MANNIITVTLTSRTRELLLERATTEHLSLERLAGNILAETVERSEWSTVAEHMERQALAAEVERIEGQRDRARDLAARLWAELEQKHTAGTFASSPELHQFVAATAEVVQLAVDIIRERMTPPPTPAREHPAYGNVPPRSPQLSLVGSGVVAGGALGADG